VLTAQLVDVAGRLGALQARVSEALVAGARFEPERRRFRPHATVARVRKGARIRPDEVVLPPAPVGSFGLEALTLFSSVLGPRARYEAVARVALR
jgi:2'-5' RNA ligase